VFAGCEPLEFKNIFPHWKDREEVTLVQKESGLELGCKRKMVDLLNQLSK